MSDALTELRAKLVRAIRASDGDEDPFLLSVLTLVDRAIKERHSGSPTDLAQCSRFDCSRFYDSGEEMWICHHPVCGMRPTP